MAPVFSKAFPIVVFDAYSPRCPAYIRMWRVDEAQPAARVPVCFLLRLCTSKMRRILSRFPSFVVPSLRTSRPFNAAIYGFVRARFESSCWPVTRSFRLLFFLLLFAVYHSNRVFAIIITCHYRPKK